MNSDGSLDTSFDTDGKQTTDFGGDDNAHGIAIQSDDYLVFAGTTEDDFGVTRYKNATSTPVELISFSATINNDAVTLTWQTATEINNYGFEIERLTETEWEQIGFVKGAGNSNSPKQYGFTDKPMKSEKFSYRLKQIDINGSYEYSETVEAFVGVPDKFELMQNYPNPFNPTTTIKFALPVNSNVKIAVYNILGDRVAMLVNREMKAGVHKVKFNASGFSSGVYFYRIQAGNYVATRKMLLLK